MDTVGNKGAHTEIQAIKIATPADRRVDPRQGHPDPRRRRAQPGHRARRRRSPASARCASPTAPTRCTRTPSPRPSCGGMPPADRGRTAYARWATRPHDPPDRTTKGPTMDFDLSAEEREIRDWVRTFVRKEIMPLEPQVLERERRGERGLTAEELKALQDKARSSGFFGIQTPESHGGMGQGAVVAALIEIELGRSFVPFRFAGEADNILFSRHRGAAGHLPPPDDRGHAQVVLRDHRARRRVRRPRHPHECPPRGRRVGHQRREDLHHRRQRGRLRHGLRRDGQGEGRRRRRHVLPRRP